MLVHMDDLRAEQVALQADEEQLTACERRLRKKVEAFGTHKETIKAHYSGKGGRERQPGPGAGPPSRWGRGHGHPAGRGDHSPPAGTGTGTDRSARVASPEGPAPAARLDQIQAQLDAVTTEAAVEEDIARIKDRLTAQPGEPSGDPAPAPAAGKRAPAPSPETGSGARQRPAALRRAEL
jgi:hypothetical protein